MSLDRNFIQIIGSPGAGKTTLIERLLKSNRSKLLSVARVEKTDAVEKPEESYDNGRDISRYHYAGAENVMHYQFPPDHQDGEYFWKTYFMLDYSEGIIIEGDFPCDFPPDLLVYVARPLSKGESLLNRVLIDHAKVRAEAFEQISKMLDDSDSAERLFDSLAGDLSMKLPKEAKNKAIAKMKASLVKEQKEPSLATEERWSIHPEFKGIELAQLVVINVHNEDEQAMAESLADEVKSIRDDLEIFQDVLSWRGRRTPITICIANLLEQKDTGTKRALTKIKRAL